MRIYQRRIVVAAGLPFGLGEESMVRAGLVGLCELDAIGREETLGITILLFSLPHFFFKPELAKIKNMIMRSDGELLTSFRGMNKYDLSFL